MNKRALVYLGLASATLAAAFVYVLSIRNTPAATQAVVQNDAAQALQSISIINGSLTTGLLNVKARQGEHVQFLVYTDESDSVIVAGLDARVAAAGQQTTLVKLHASAAGTHAIELDVAGVEIGQIKVLPK